MQCDLQRLPNVQMAGICVQISGFVCVGYDFGILAKTKKSGWKAKEAFCEGKGNVEKALVEKPELNASCPETFVPPYLDVLSFSLQFKVALN